MKRTITIETDDRFTDTILAALRLMKGVIRISDTDSIPEVKDDKLLSEMLEARQEVLEKGTVDPHIIKTKIRTRIEAS